MLAVSEMPEEDLIVAILMGLPQEYDIVVGLVNNELHKSKILDDQDTDVSLQDVLSLALSQEARIEQQKSSTTLEIQGAMANYSSQGAMANYSDTQGRGRAPNRRGGYRGRGGRTSIS